MKRLPKAVNSKGKKRGRADGYENKVVNCDIHSTGLLGAGHTQIAPVFKQSTKLSYVAN